MRVEWSKRALADIRELRDYIAADSPTRAQDFIGRLVSSIENIEIFPAMGRAVPEAEGRDDVREIIHQGYRAIYLVQPDRVFVVGIVHHSRNIMGFANKPWNGIPS